MNKINDGGPAFPVITSEVVESRSEGKQTVVFHTINGMSLRDWFAGQVLAGWNETYHGLAFAINSKYGPVEMVMVAYQIADAMIAARGELNETNKKN